MRSWRVRDDLVTKQQQEMLYVWWTQNENTSCNHKAFIFKNHKGLQKANINRKYCTFSDGVSEMDCQLGRPVTQSGCLSIISSLLAQTVGQIPEFVNANENNKGSQGQATLTKLSETRMTIWPRQKLFPYKQATEECKLP